MTSIVKGPYLRGSDSVLKTQYLHFDTYALGGGRIFSSSMERESSDQVRISISVIAQALKSNDSAYLEKLFD